MIQQENKDQGNAITRNQSKQQGDIQQKEALDMIIPTLKKKRIHVQNLFKCRKRMKC